MTVDTTTADNTHHGAGPIQVPRILLYAGTAPGEPNVGGTVLRDMCDLLQPGQLRCFAVPTPSSLEQMKQSPELADHVLRRYDTAFRPLPGLAGELISLAARKVKRPGHLKTIVDRAVKCGREHKAELVWAVFHCPTVIQTAKEVAARLGVPLVVWVEDAPELLSHQLHHDRWYAEEVMRDTRATIEASARVGVIGETMKADYDERYGTDSIILRHGLKTREIAVASERLGDPDKVVIGYCGSITAGDAFNQFLSGLDNIGWRMEGREVILRMMGCRVVLDPVAPRRIEYFGRLPTVNDTINVLSQCDLLYLPQPFAEDLRYLATISFPAKLATYLASGRPVMLHAPDYASLVPFYQKYPFGNWCRSLQGDKAVEAVRDLVCNPERYREALEQVHAGASQELNQGVLRKRLQQFLGGKADSAPATQESHLCSGGV